MAIVPSVMNQGLNSKITTAGPVNLLNTNINGNKTIWNNDGSAYTIQDANGNTVGGGLKGTENYKLPSHISNGGGGSSSGGYSYPNQYESLVNSIYDKQRDAQLQALYNSRDRAVGKINQQKAETAPQYQNMRNQADVVNSQNVQKLREMMASNGLNASGENVTASVGLQSARQNALNTLNTQEQQIMNDFDRQIADINNPAEEQALIAALEAQRSQALYEAAVRADDVGYARSRDALADSRYNQEWNYQVGRDQVADGRYDKEWDYQVGRDQVADKRYDQEWAYQKERDELEHRKWQVELNWQKQQFNSEKQWREYTFNNMSASEKAQLEENKRQHGEEMAWRLYETQYNGNLALSQNQATIDGYNNLNFNVGTTGSSGSGGYTNTYKTTGQASKSSTFKTYQNHMAQAVQKGGVPAEWVPLMTELIGRESSWNSSAKNPTSTAHGYGQFLKSTRQNYEKKMGLSYSDPVNQIIMMTQYVKDRYGTPAKALAFWDKNKWY